MGVSITLVLLILVALAFDFMNGLHDAANSIATIVSTRVLKPQYAVVWAAFFNFAAFFVFGVHVANTVGSGIVDPNLVDDPLIFGALMGAISWNAITWWGGIPSSSSHALIGGIVGAGVAKAGFSAVIWSGLRKTIYRHRALALHRLRAGAAAGAVRELGLRQGQPGLRRRLLPQVAARLGRALFAGPRQQRRAEDGGHHRGAALFARHLFRVHRAGLGDPLLLHASWAWER